MMEALVGMVVMAGLFAVFGALRIADRKGCGGGCAGCSHDCEHHVEGGVS